MSSGVNLVETPLLSLRSVRRHYINSTHAVDALQSLNLKIYAGEMVAIMGPSGSGKSTLLNILGCLDKPNEGSYRINGREVMTMTAEDLAAFRRKCFGFIFQRYQLVEHLTAEENVALPAIYSGINQEKRLAHARYLLDQVGLSERLGHHPSQLSGGQQQRVGVARALMNGGQVILADEPTGALDEESGIELMRLLCKLNERGHTIIVVTHDPKVAAYTQRIIQIGNGRIFSDQRTQQHQNGIGLQPISPNNQTELRLGFFRRYKETIRTAIQSVIRKPLQSTLTIMGVAVGIAAVSTVNGLAEGARVRTVSDIMKLGVNTITFNPGKPFDTIEATKPALFNDADYELLKIQPYVDKASPEVRRTSSLKVGATSVNATVSGVSEDFFSMQRKRLASGRFFNLSEVRDHAAVVVLDYNARKWLFSIDEDPIGRIVAIDKMLAVVIGVEAKDEDRFASASILEVFVPYTTAMSRVPGDAGFSSITVRVREGMSNDSALTHLERTLGVSRGDKAFFSQSVDTIIKLAEKTSRQLTFLALFVAGISLVVGGINVMNMMLVTVNERVPEIGLRLAVGARHKDILHQFLAESMFLCFLGGILGLILTTIVYAGISTFFSTIPISAPGSIVPIAIVSSICVGAIFGFWPAKNAAMLEPVIALNK